MFSLVNRKGFVCTKLKDFTISICSSSWIFGDIRSVPFFGSEGMSMMGSSSGGLWIFGDISCPNSSLYDRLFLSGIILLHLILNVISGITL